MEKLKLKSFVSTRNIVEHCARECQKQQSGELSVSWMFDAWIWTVTYGIDHAIFGESIIKPNVKFIRELGKIIEPTKNSDEDNFRKVAVKVRGEIIPVTDFEVNLNNLIETGWFPTNVEKFYFGFERIHPFIDGNGRVGNILFNLLNQTIYNPVDPPEWNR
jgi:hypothetical protein